MLKTSQLFTFKSASAFSLRPYATQVVKMPECDFKPEKYKVNEIFKFSHALKKALI
jgi:hypothetical protein